MITNPSVLNAVHAARRKDEELRPKDVSRVLGMIRSALRPRGGDVELVDVRGREVVVRLSGACDGCPVSFSENAGVIERVLRSRLPQIEQLAVV
jgi:Fe-S cluster biogenesis protein NfuA